MARRSTLGLFLCAALTSCSGGSSTLPHATVTPAGGATSGPNTSSVSIAIKIPVRPGTSALRRRPAYISTYTQSAAISINGAAPIVIGLAANSPTCTPTANGRTCTISVAAPVGSVTFAETLYAGLNATGAVLSVGRTAATIVAGQANTVTLTLDGVIASISLAVSNATPPIGSPASIALTVTASDAGGAAIIGNDPFVTPVALTDSDHSGITSLSKTLLNSPADAAALTVQYSGAVLAQAVIGASSGSIVAPSVTIKPQQQAAVQFNNYTTFGYDNQRDVFNPNSTAITPATLANVHLAWQSALGGGDFNSQTQPILATNIPGHTGVLFVGGATGNVYGYDALTGAELWHTPTGEETYQCEGNNTIYFGVGGTVAYDVNSRSLYAVGNTNAVPNGPATNSLYHLDAGTGAVLGQVNIAPAVPGWPSLDFSHTSVMLDSNGLAYVGTSATCDISSWRGRIAAISVPAMTLANTFYTVWNGTTQPWGGGGVWGWGGVSLGFDGNILTGVGNTDNGMTSHGQIVPPYVAAPEEYSGLGEALIKVSPDLSTLVDSNHPIPLSAYGGVSTDLDVNGTPTVFTPNGTGCDPLAALQAKSGALYFYDATRIGNGPIGQFQLSPSTYSDGFLGGPAYSPATGLLYAAVPSSAGSFSAPGMVAINPGCGSPSVTWNSAFGPDSYPSGTPRSVPAVSAGGVVLVGTLCSSDGNGGCAASASTIRRGAQSASRKPLICCAPPGTGDGALWALDAQTGTVLNGGLPIMITSGPLRVPPTIDGNWIFVLDNNGEMYGLTVDPAFPAIASKMRSVDSRMLRHWEPQPRS